METKNTFYRTHSSVNVVTVIVSIFCLFLNTILIAIATLFCDCMSWSMSDCSRGTIFITCSFMLSLYPLLIMRILRGPCSTGVFAAAMVYFTFQTLDCGFDAKCPENSDISRLVRSMFLMSTFSAVCVFHKIFFFCVSPQDQKEREE